MAWFVVATRPLVAVLAFALAIIIVVEWVHRPAQLQAQVYLEGRHMRFPGTQRIEYQEVLIMSSSYSFEITLRRNENEKCQDWDPTPSFHVFKMGEGDKWKRLNDLGKQVRVLAVITFIIYFIGSVSLVFVCAGSLSTTNHTSKYNIRQLAKEHTKDDRELTAFENAKYLIFLTTLAILSLIASIFMVIATIKDNVWCTIPFLLMLLILIGWYLYQLMYDGFCVGKCGLRVVQAVDGGPKPSAFTQNVMHDGGGSYIFSSLTVLAFILYALIITVGYFCECWAKRKEAIKQWKATHPKVAPPPPRRKQTNPERPPPPPPPPVQSTTPPPSEYRSSTAHSSRRTSNSNPGYEG